MEQKQIQTSDIESMSLVEVLEQYVETYRDILGDTRCSFLKEQATTYAAKMEDEYFAVEFIKKRYDENNCFTLANGECISDLECIHSVPSNIEE